MSRFWDQAREIYSAAAGAAERGQDLTEMSILIRPEGGLHLVAASDWSLESLREWHGAASAYRVSSANGQVRVEGKDRAAHCLIESETPKAIAARLLADRRDYTLVEPPRGLLTA